MRTQVLLLFGGESSEHEVSIVSARNVYEALDKQKYDLRLCYISREGKWSLVEDMTQLESGQPLMPVMGEKKFLTQNGGELAPDVVFPVLHGKNGEDGTVQGLAELLHIPIVGCGVLASALCMDKLLAKKTVVNDPHSGTKTARWMTFGGKDKADVAGLVSSITDPGFDQGTSHIESSLGPAPWFVKPSRAGSSVGVSKVEKVEDLEKAIQEAFKYDDTVLIEEGVIGKELEVAVLGNPPNHTTSKVGEIIPGDAFYSYDDKYADDSASQVLLDADVPHAIKEVIRKQAARIYETLGCTGLARVDFFLKDGSEVYFNEVNTLPGFTNISMYPKLMMETGMTYGELCDKLITLALEV